MRLNSFNPVASAYSKKVTPYRAYQYYSLIHELMLKGNEKILDIGSGPGELSLQIARQLNGDGYMFGIDISDNMIKLARKAARQNHVKNIVFKRGDALNLEFDDNSFDAVTSSNAFPWVHDRKRFIEEVRRVLAPGGRFVLAALSSKCYREFSNVFGSVQKDFEEIPKGHPFKLMGAKLHTVKELSSLIESTGLKIEKRYEILTEEPISVDGYLERVNSIVNENYLDFPKSAKRKRELQNNIRKGLELKNGTLKITESVVIIKAVK